MQTTFALCIGLFIVAMTLGGVVSFSRSRARWWP